MRPKDFSKFLLILPILLVLSIGVSHAQIVQTEELPQDEPSAEQLRIWWEGNNTGLYDSIPSPNTPPVYYSDTGFEPFSYRGDTYSNIELDINGSNSWTGGLPHYIGDGINEHNKKPNYVPYVLDDTVGWISYSTGAVSWTFDKNACGYKIFEAGKKIKFGSEPIIESISITLQEFIQNNWETTIHNSMQCDVVVNILENNVVQVIATQGNTTTGYKEIELYQEAGKKLETFYRSPIVTVNGTQYGFVESQITTDDSEQEFKHKDKTFKTKKVKDKITKSDIKDTPHIELKHKNGDLKYDPKDHIHNALTDITIEQYGVNDQLNIYYDFHETPQLSIGEKLEIDPEYVELLSPSYGARKSSQSPTGSCHTPITIFDNGIIYAANNGYCATNSYEWNTTSIQDNATITNTVFRADYTSAGVEAINCEINKVSAQPSGQSATTRWNEAEGSLGVPYISSTSACTSNGNDKVLDLGTTADSDLEGRLGADWFGIGMGWVNYAIGTSAKRVDVNSGELLVNYTIPNCYPNAPTGANATPLNTTSILISWSAPNNCTNDNTEVQYTDGQSAWSNIYSSTPKTNHTQTGLDVNEDYFYRVRYQSEQGDWGTYSANATTWTSPNAPTSLVVVPTSLTQLNLNWIGTTGPGNVEFLIVGGGAGGGGAGFDYEAGGGGHGGFLNGTEHEVPVQEYTITVGSGGSSGSSGGQSSFDSMISEGGDSALHGPDDGNGGSSGGIDGSGGNNPTKAGGGGNQYAAGGGGGAGENGIGAVKCCPPAASVPGIGGAGESSSITGSEVYYAAGGGGGNRFGGGGAGGLGGGGAGGSSGGAGVAGTANTGSGGGGCGAAFCSNGGTGGSGIVIIRYLDSTINATGGVETTDGDYRIHSFLSSGTFNVTNSNGTAVGITYNVERLDHTTACTGDSTWDIIDTGVNTEAYNDTTTTNECKEYRVRAVNAGGTSEASNTDYNATYPSAPINLVANADGPTSLLLSWDNIGFGATGHKIEREFPLPQAEYLIVAGGGGGGGGSASVGACGRGGGGAGGFQTADGHGVTVQNYVVTVGGGGAGGGGANSNGASGSNSVFDGITSFGGAGGGFSGSGASGGQDGTGSGGGARPSGGQGGGGSGGTGGGVSCAGATGGIGYQSDILITGNNVYYSGGGGGGGNAGGKAGGAGGGGTGTDGHIPGGAGAGNTGGGGGGTNYTGAGGSGGSGIVVIRYLTTSMTATGGIETTDGAYSVHKFTSTGNFNVTSVATGWDVLANNTGTPVTLYLDTGLNSGTSYTYRVSTTNESGIFSSPSAEASGTPIATTKPINNMQAIFDSYNITINTQDSVAVGYDVVRDNVPFTNNGTASNFGSITVDPISYIRFDDLGTNPLDYGSRDSGTTTTTGTLDYRTSPLGHSAYFDGNDYITLNNESDFDFNYNTPLSYSFWIYPFDYIDTQIVLDKRTAVAGYNIKISSGEVLAHRFVDAGSNVFDCNSTETLNIGQWNHIAIVYDYTSGSPDCDMLTYYFDGVADTTVTIGETLGETTILNNGDVTIGAGFDGSFKLDNSSLDDFRIYDYDLTSDQVLELYQKQYLSKWKYPSIDSIADNVLAYWDFDNTLLDKTRNGNDWVLFSGSETYVDGTFGRSVIFDDYEYRNVGLDDNFDLHVNDDWSVAFRYQMNNVPTSTQTYDFSTDPFTTADATKLSVSGGVAEITSVQDNTNDAMVIPLDSVADSTWTLDYDFRVTEQNENMIWTFGLCEGDETVTAAVTDDCILYRHDVDVSNAGGIIDSIDGGTAPLPSHPFDDTETISYVTNTWYYLRLVNLGGGNYYQAIYSDANRTVLVDALYGEHNVSSYTNLNYIKFMNRITNNVGSDTFEIDNLNFYSGASEYLLSKGDLTAGGWNFYSTSEGNFGMYLHSAAGDYIICRTGTGFDDGVMRDYIFTHSSTGGDDCDSVTMYIDGIETTTDDTEAGTLVNLNNNDVLTLGVISGGTAGTEVILDDELDILMITSDVMTQDEVWAFGNMTGYTESDTVYIYDSDVTPPFAYNYTTFAIDSIGIQQGNTVFSAPAPDDIDIANMTISSNGNTIVIQVDQEQECYGTCHGYYIDKFDPSHNSTSLSFMVQPFDVQPLAYWKFDGKETGRISYGTIDLQPLDVFSPESYRSGVVGSAAFFDGDYYFKGLIADENTFGPGTGNMSGFAWIKTNNTISSSGDIFHKGYSGGTTEKWAFSVNSDGTFQLVVQDEAGDKIDVTTTVEIDDGDWHHVGFTKVNGTAASTVSLYLDGVGVSETITTDTLTTLVDNSVPLTIGAREDNVGTVTEQLDNPTLLDELRFYDAVLTTTEVSSLYNYTSPAIDSNSYEQELIHYKFNDYSYDSAHGYNAKIIGSPIFASGKINNAIDFVDSQANYLSISNSDFPFRDYNEAKSYAFWFNGIEDGAQQTLFNDYDGTIGSFLQLRTDGKIRFEERVVNPTNHLEIETDSDVSDGTYKHFVLTLDGTGSCGGTNMYIDSVSQGLTCNKDTLSSSVANTADFLIGADPIASYDSELDDFRYFEFELSQSQINEIYNSGSGTENPLDVTPLTVPFSFVDSDVDPGTIYNYTIYPVNGAGQAGGSPELSQLTYIPPDPPGNFTAISIDPTPLNVQLSWDQSTDLGNNTSITGYTIDFSESGGPWTFLTIVTPITTTNYIDSGALPGTDYGYRITTLGDIVNGTSYTVANVTTADGPDAPPFIEALPKIGNTSAQLNWATPLDDGGSTILGYKIEMQTNGGGYATLVNNTFSLSTTGVLNSLSVNNTYDVKVSGWNGAANGPANTTTVEMSAGSLDVVNIGGGGTIGVSPTLSLTYGVPDTLVTKLEFYRNDELQQTFFPNQVIPKGGDFTFSTFFDYPEGLEEIRPGDYNYFVIAYTTNGESGQETLFTSPEITFSTVLLASGSYGLTEQRNEFYNVSIAEFVAVPANYSVVLVYREANSFDPPTFYAYDNVIVNVTQNVDVDPSLRYYITAYKDPTFPYVVGSPYGSPTNATIPIGYPVTGSTVSNPSPFAQQGIGIDTIAGESGLFGLPIVFIFIIVLASVFTGRSAPMGIIFVAVAIGIMVYMGLISFEFDPANQSNLATWAIIIVAVIVGVMIGKRWD